MITLEGDFRAIRRKLALELQHRGTWVAARTWQGQDISTQLTMSPLELMNVSIETSMVWDLNLLQEIVEPNTRWADMHFEERVGGNPVNPPPSTQIWPYSQKNHGDYLNSQGRFSHTYPERFWPEHAGGAHDPVLCGYHSGGTYCDLGENRGIWFKYGDLSDVVRLLQTDLYTRQAFLPIFFPEDTGATEGQRIPCSLGYHFMVRKNRSSHDELHIIYYLRSCDYLRHFRDDVYLAIRLARWMRDEILADPEISTFGGISAGKLTMHMASLHVFAGDMVPLSLEIENLNQQESQRIAGAMG